MEDHAVIFIFNDRRSQYCHGVTIPWQIIMDIFQPKTDTPRSRNGNPAVITISHAPRTHSVSESDSQSVADSAAARMMMMRN